MPQLKPGSVYKRMETDAELRKRLRVTGRVGDMTLYAHRGEELDLIAEGIGMQRRLIEAE